MIGFVDHKESVADDLNCENTNGAINLLEFDSGRHISMPAALLHLLYLGTTGTGKTVSGMLPAIRNHILAGNRGLIIDIKGNLWNKVRALAKEAGRENDIIEFGTSPCATPVNILANMDAPIFYNFSLDLIKDSFDSSSNNMDFHVKGCGISRDCFVLLKFLSEKEQDFTPNLLTIQEMFSNHQKATELFDYFVNNVANKEDEEQRKFIDMVQASQFSVLTQTKQKLKGAGSTHHEQMEYNTHGIKNALKAFLDVPGVAEKFCTHGNLPIDMLEMLKAGKIILLRFGPETGPIGAQLSRLILNSFYEAILEHGLTMAGAQSFVAIDEFQEVADLSKGRFSDTNFIAQAREFRSGFMAATQSAASLMNRGNSEAAVQSFISNCNSKVFFFSDDPLTRDIAKRYDPDIDLIDLKAGETFTIGYNAITRERFWGRETLNKAHHSIKDLQPLEMEPVPKTAFERPTLYKLVDKYVPAAEKEEKVEPKRYERARNNVNTEEISFMPDWIKEEFQCLFTDNAIVRIPIGWREHVKHTLSLFKDLDLGLRITQLRLNSDYKLKARANFSGGDNELEMLNKMLAHASGICMSCGEQLPPPQEDDDDDNDDDDDGWNYSDLQKSENRPVPICAQCLEKHELSQVNKK